ncbi:hypothetical protein GGX14DRAFT_630139 [Mycena pura]|uniref:C2H2-type domain-containing protein n=1 Tax=Mycena pura TaxID=153505 RepID=A0AAD6YS37_9AGAR|nr:hypothetical protein GGX14DRAFT_630139 [Mycena pura]
MDSVLSNSYLHSGDAELAPESPSGGYSFNVDTADFAENIGVNVGDEQQAVYRLTPSSLVIRAHSCGDQDVPRPSSGPRRRTQSDRTDISTRMSSAHLSSTLDSSAVDDEYSNEALPEITLPPAERTNPPSVDIYIPPQSHQHMIPSPGMLSPYSARWSYSAGSEASSVGSSPSPSAYHVRISSADGFPGPAGYDGGSPDPNQLWRGDAIEHQYLEEDVIRGRSMQRRKHSDSNADSSTVASLVESLSIAEGTSTEHAQPNYDLSHQQPEVQYGAFSAQETGYIYSTGVSQAYALQENPSPYSEPPVSNEASFHTSPAALGYPFGYDFRYPHSPSSDTGSSIRSSSSHSFTPSAQGNADEALRDARHRDEYLTSLNTTGFSVSQGGVQRTTHRRRDHSPYLQGRDTDREWIEHQRGGSSSSSVSRDDGLARLHPQPSALSTDVIGHAQRQHEHGSLSLPDPSWVHQRGESSSSLDFSLSSVSTSGGGLADAPGDQPGTLPQGTSSKEKQDAKKFRAVGSPAGRRAAKNRRKDQTMPGAFICKVCNADFTAKHNLRNHMNSHGSVKEFRCDTCGQSFGTSHVLKRHEGKCLTTTFPQGSF